MKWVKCLRNDYGNSHLEINKIYEVLTTKIINNQQVLSPYTITIRDKFGINTYLIKDHINNINFFEDATAEVREQKLNQLLDDKNRE